MIDLDQALMRIKSASEANNDDECMKVLEELVQKAKDKIPRIVIGLDGGLVQGATSDCQVEVLVFDYDTEGADEDELCRDDKGTPCFISSPGEVEIVNEAEMDGMFTLVY